MILDAVGNLYGTTAYGSVLGGGTVFELSPSGNDEWTETVLYAFDGGEGAYPIGGLMFDGAGSLCGTSSQFGPGFGGTAFKLSPTMDGNWNFVLLYAFNNSRGSQDGAGPAAGLVMDDEGNLYGTTTFGGQYQQDEFYGYGTVFELSPNFDGTWTESILYSFAGGSDGATPQTALAFDTVGNLYGTTHDGGSGGFSCSGNGCGTVFALVPDGQGGWNERLFRLPKDGHLGVWPSVPGPPLVMNGRVYVTTNDGANQFGCTGTCGTILQFTP